MDLFLQPAIFQEINLKGVAGGGTTWTEVDSQPKGLGFGEWSSDIIEESIATGGLQFVILDTCITWIHVLH